VEERTKLQIMVGMKVGDDDGPEAAKIDVLVKQPSCDAKPTIHHNLLAAETDQR
jgi:hypothetical protein